jgi:hypothetical protein
MWNRSYRWQRQLRLAAGVLVLVSLLAGLAVFARTSPARRAGGGARDLVNELRSSSELTINVAVPVDLEPRPGTLVYQEREDGAAQVIGRVVSVEPAEGDRARLSIRLMSPLAGAANLGGTLKGAPSSLDLRDAVRLLISPSSPAEEAIVARDTIWPSVRAHVVPEMIDGLIRETTKELEDLDEQDEALLTGSVQRLHELLKPLEDKLVDRLASRTWETVGVQGLAAGIWRQTTANVGNNISTTDWLWRWIGKKQPEGDQVERPFFSEQVTKELRTALEEEALEVWHENRTEIIEALKKVVVERRGDFEAAFRDRWAELLYRRAIAPAWAAGQEKVLASIQVYANDFASRRLLTKAGGPRLMFAYALRCSLKISNDPLLVYVPGAGKGTDRIVYEPLLR